MKQGLLVRVFLILFLWNSVFGVSSGMVLCFHDHLLPHVEVVSVDCDEADSCGESDPTTSQSQICASEIEDCRDLQIKAEWLPSNRTDTESLNLPIILSLSPVVIFSLLPEGPTGFPPATYLQGPPLIGELREFLVKRTHLRV